jgi:hypothetical protein
MLVHKFNHTASKLQQELNEHQIKVQHHSETSANGDAKAWGATVAYHVAR